VEAFCFVVLITSAVLAYNTLKPAVETVAGVEICLAKDPCRKKDETKRGNERRGVC
jgi:hypothetical protein